MFDTKVSLGELEKSQKVSRTRIIWMTTYNNNPNYFFIFSD